MEILAQQQEVAQAYQASIAVAPSVLRDAARLEKERRVVEDEIRTTRTAAKALRRERSQLVAAALTMIRQDAAKRTLRALADLRSAIAILDEAAVEVCRAGGEAQRVPLPSALGEIEAQARRIAEKDAAE